VAPSRPPTPDEPGPTRRTFLHASTAALALGAAAPLNATGQAVPAAPTSPRSEGRVEWRNKQPGMAYRRLGLTGMMISEVVSGGDPITPENFKHLRLAIEMGLNYLDMAPAYHNGGTERAYGKLLAESPGLRDKVFLTTKVSGLKQLREKKYRAIFDGLSAAKQKEIREWAKALRAERAVDKPGYHFTYFPGQARSLDDAYLRAAMMPEFAARVEGDTELKRFIIETVEGSLKRVGTDHFDVVMCPHGADTAEDASRPESFDAFQDLQRQGKARFLGVTSHNEPAGVLRAAAAAGFYDVVMMAYNVVNGGYVEDAIREASRKGVGVIAMKVAMAVATHHKPLQPVPEWRIKKVERIVPGDWKAPQKAYLWALQNPNISAVISNLWDETYVKENLALAGRKVELQPA
jgi:aryl-alcohol dehydrogenase-like predicted oxidoreductase